MPSVGRGGSPRSVNRKERPFRRFQRGGVRTPDPVAVSHRQAGRTAVLRRREKGGGGFAQADRACGEDPIRRFCVAFGLLCESSNRRAKKSFIVRIFLLSLCPMHKWLTILLACIAVQLGGGEITASASSAVKQSPAVVAESASQESEFKAGRQMLADAITEYASNPAYSNSGTETFGGLQRCPVTIPSGNHFMRYGRLPEASSDDSSSRIPSHFNTRIPCAVLHPVDYYVFRMRRLLI